MSIIERIKQFNKFILISDIHLGVHSDSIEWINNIKQYFRNFFIPTIKKIDNNDVAVIIAGDVFDNRQKLDISVMCAAQEIFNEILSINSNICIFAITGNHDLYRKNKTDEKTLTSLKCICHDRFYIIDDVLKCQLNNGQQILFVPWQDTREIETEIVKKTDADIIIMHTDINGGTYDNGREIVNGVNINVTNAKKIYSGHIHTRQESLKRTYLGSPYHTNRSDIGNEKGLYILTLLNGKINESFIINDYSPKYIKITYNEYINYNDDELANVIRNNYIDFIIDEDDLNKIKMSDILNRVETLEYKKFEVIVNKNTREIKYENASNQNVTIDAHIKNYINTLDELSDEDRAILSKMNDVYFSIIQQEI